MKKYIKCDCINTFQDEMFGKGNRLYMANPENKKELLCMICKKKVDENTVFVDEESAQ